MIHIFFVTLNEKCCSFQDFAFGFRTGHAVLPFRITPFARFVAQTALQIFDSNYLRIFKKNSQMRQLVDSVVDRKGKEVHIKIWKKISCITTSEWKKTLQKETITAFENFFGEHSSNFGKSKNLKHDNVNVLKENAETNFIVLNFSTFSTRAIVRIAEFFSFSIELWCLSPFFPNHQRNQSNSL